MIKINVSKQKNFSINSSKIKKALRDKLQNEGIVSDTEVSVAIVDEEKMKSLGQKYLKEKKADFPHNVLSFTASEVKNFINPPDGIIRLGEIVLCFPVLKEEAKKEGKLIDKKACELVSHGAMHLLGFHHK